MGTRLVSNFNQVRNNHAVYQQEMTSKDRGRIQPLIDVIPYIQSWIAVRDRDSGKWLFAPSKFIGYTDMDAERYGRFHKAMDGRLTERVLDPWVRLLGADDGAHEEARDELFEFCAKFDKTPNGRCRISVLVDPDAEVVESRRSALVDLLVEVFKALPSDHQKEVAQRLGLRRAA